MPEERAYTTFQAAKICHVSHHSIKNWIKQGLIQACRTPGGHYRILKSDLEAFRRRFNMIPADKTRKVLIVDDDPDALKMMTRILEQENFTVHAVSSPTEAGIAAAQESPDIVLLDFLMPELDGFEVCKALKSNEKTQDIPIIAVTCLTKKEEVKRIRESGVTDYIAKPFKVEDLLEKVNGTLAAI